MWSPICDLVELERPPLERVYEKIEKLFGQLFIEIEILAEQI